MIHTYLSLLRVAEEMASCAPPKAPSKCWEDISNYHRLKAANEKAKSGTDLTYRNASEFRADVEALDKSDAVFLFAGPLYNFVDDRSGLTGLVDKLDYLNWYAQESEEIVAFLEKIGYVEITPRYNGDRRMCKAVPSSDNNPREMQVILRRDIEDTWQRSRYLYSRVGLQLMCGCFENSFDLRCKTASVENKP